MQYRVFTAMGQLGHGRGFCAPHQVLQLLVGNRQGFDGPSREQGDGELRARVIVQREVVQLLRQFQFFCLQHHELLM